MDINFLLESTHMFAEDSINDSSEDSLTRRRHAAAVLDVINAMWKSRQLCDVVIVVENTDFPAHRMMLASASPYFRAMFTGNVLERESTSVVLKEMTPLAFSVILDWVYSGDLNLTVVNVEETLVAASILQMKTVLAYAERFLLKHITPDNCIGIMRIADMYGCQKLLKASKEFCQLRFCDVVTSEEFLALQTNELIEILRQDTLNVKNEEQVYNAVMVWLAYDMLARTPEMPEILEYVRLPLVDWSFLKQQVEACKVFQREDCRRFLIEATQYQARLYHPDLVNFQFNSSSLRAQPRFSFVNPEYVYIVGGEASDNAADRRGRELLSRVDRYHASTGEWSRLPDLPNGPCRGPGCVVANGVLYVIGGSNGVRSLHATLALDLHWLRWRELALLGQPRSSVAVATNGDLVYAFGGNTGYESIDSVERYDPSANIWTRVKDMNMRRSMAAAAYVNGYFYVLGGYDGLRDLVEVERYDVKVDQWQFVAPMRFPRSMCCAAVMKGQLFIAGGSQNQNILASAGDTGGSSEVPQQSKCTSCVCEVDSYDPRSDAWETGRVTPLPLHRRGLGLAAASQRLFAFGGVTNCSGLGTQQYHDALVSCQPEFSLAPVVGDITIKQQSGAAEWQITTMLPVAASRFGCCSS